MNEIMELKSYRTNEVDDNVSDEYHEISNELLLETDEMYPLKTTPIKEYDFFTNIDTKSLKNQELKKKKSKKKRQPTSFIELIRSELAAKPLLEENKIIMIDHSTKRASYLENLPKNHKIFQRRCETEDRFQHHQRTGTAPIFPLVLENRINRDLGTPIIQYKEPISFNNVVSEYIIDNVKKNPKLLDVVLNNIRFKHHHEFCLEELLCVKVTELYSAYENIKKNLKDISKTIDINRITRNNLKNQLLKISPNRNEEVKYDKNVQKYTGIMIEAKQKYQFAIQEKKQTVHQIVSLWEDIKMVREKCGRIRKNLIIDVIKNDLDEKEYQLQWMQLFESEYTDAVIQIEYNFIKRYKEYKELKRNKNISKCQKPKLEIDYDSLKMQVEEIVNDIMSDNKYDLKLTYDDSIVTNKNDKRKSYLAKNFSFKVYVDDVFVCETEEYQTKRHHFDVDFLDSLSIEILPHNSKISIILFENSEPVSLYNVNLAEIKIIRDDSLFRVQEFMYNTISEPSSKCIGSGYEIKAIAAKNKARLKSSNIFKEKLFTRCEVFVRLGWNDKLNNDNHELIKSSTDLKQMILRILNGKEEPTLDGLTAAISNLYENAIVDNENVMLTLKSIRERVINNNEGFNGDINPEYSRFKLLYLRNNGMLVDMENKYIPLFASQFTTEQLGCLQSTGDVNNVDYCKFESHSKMNSIDLQRFIGVKFVEKLNSNLASIVNSLLLKKTYRDVVRDFEDFTLRSLFSNSINLSLGVNSKFIRKELLEEKLSNEQEIHVTVLRAFNLLNRAVDIVSDDKTDDDDIAGFKIHPLRPLVRVSYHGVSVETTTAIGCHPTWNTTVKIKSKLEPLSSIHIDVYDQCKESVESFSEGSGIVNYRKCNKWLGGLKIPIHTVLDLGEVWGTFIICMPPLVLGYENMSLNAQTIVVPELMNHMKKEASLISLQIRTTVSYLGGLQTYFQPLPNDSDDDVVMGHLNGFVNEYRRCFPSRNISLTFIDSSRRNKCVTEFVQPIPMPDYDYFPLDPRKPESALSKSSGYSKSSSSKSSRKKSLCVENEKDLEGWKTEENMLTKNIEAAVRYVSLIPTYEVKDSHVTLTGVELLKVLYGSPLDHTILLASYLLHLGVKCWIIIGFGLPRGQSSYVLVKYYGNKPLMINEQQKTGVFFGKNVNTSLYVYDAVSGDRYSLREIGCPLRKISYVFDCDNIWVNVQNSQECEKVATDFTKSSDWQAVFSKPLFSLRPSTEGLYSKPSDVEELRLSLETKIKIKVQKWRSHVKTIWNRYCSSLLRDTLAQWEYWAFNSSQPRPALGHRFKQFMASYKIFGFPINTSYLNTQKVISTVKATSLHASDDPSVEFALAVEVYAYPNNVFSVWVFLASVTRI